MDQRDAIYLGTVTVTTNAAGNVAFFFRTTSVPSGAHFITATATDQTNNTSEFSNVVSY